MEYSKEITLRALANGRKFKFVESEKEVIDYYNKQTYAIKKDSTILKELIKERDTPLMQQLIKEAKFPIDNQLLRLQEGYYHIIDIYQKEPELKSQIRIENIAFALYKGNESGDYWNKIYQVKLNPLTNKISERLLSNDHNLYNLIGKTIRVFSFELNEAAKSYKVSWEGVEEIEIRINKIDYENFLVDKFLEEEAMNEAMYEDYLIEQAEEQALYEESIIEQAELQAVEEQAMYDETYFFDEQ